MASEIKRTQAREIEGVVVRDKMSKTRVIEVKRLKRHALYGKGLIRRSRFFVHDEKNVSQMGDKVLCISTRPLSKNKNFRLVKVLEKRAES